MSFKKYLEDEMLEAAGNLSGLPSTFIKEITGNSGSNNLGGENSEIKLFKSNAKVKDITDACKLVGGFVASKDAYRRSYSPAELKAKSDKQNNAGVLVKIDDVWAFYAKWDSLGDGNKKFQLITDEGVKTVKDAFVHNHPRFGKSYNQYNRQYLSGLEISDIIDFKNSKVDVYLVTTDFERVAKRLERETNRTNPREISLEKKKAILKFLEKKSEGMIQAIKDDVQETIDKLNSYVEKTIKKATTGEDFSFDIDIENILKELKEKLKEANSIGYYIKEIVNDGTIKDNYYKNRNSHAFERFMELAKSFKNEEI